MKRVYPFLGVCLFQFLVVPLTTGAETSFNTTIVISPRAAWSEAFAAREVRRYLYLRTGRLLPIKTALEDAALHSSIIVVATKGDTLLEAMRDPADSTTAKSLKAQSYWLKTFPAGSLQFKPRDLPSTHPVLLLAGGDETGTLYAAYRLAEILGVRFYLDRDVIPDERLVWAIPELDIHESPLFTLRGIQPFHDFPEGPDWWNREDYLAILGQLPKLRMNFFGLHTYPEDRPNAEPTVWIGPATEIGDKGKVRFSYSSSYQNTLRGNWGYASLKTSAFVFGTDQLFEEDGFGADVMRGCVPGPSYPEACNQVFERTADMLAQAFGFAHQLGIKTCVGTETPLVIPKAVQQRLSARGKNPADNSSIQELYEGIFRRAAQAYPLDYFWFWTPEGWTWSGVKEEEISTTTNDLFNAIAAWKEVKPPFGLATCGWVLGPPQDRALFDKVLPKSIALHQSAGRLYPGGSRLCRCSRTFEVGYPLDGGRSRADFAATVGRAHAARCCRCLALWL
jgi:hypothetical protein